MPEVRALPREAERAAADVVAAAFLHDPGWCAVGPRSEGRRLRMVRGYTRGLLAAARRWGDPVLGAYDGDRVVGVLIAFAEGRYPPPLWAMAFEARGIVPAGPPTWVRGLRGQAVLDAGHPDEPHVFVSFLAVSPDSQRKGAGRALLGDVIADADSRDVPVYLDTANPDNLPYYRSFGFEPTGEARLPRDTPAWYLLRPVGAT